GLNWSSLTSTSAGRPPSLPPWSFTASRKPSRMSMPSADDGPDSVLTKPTFTLSAAAAGPTASAAARGSAARAARSWRMVGDLSNVGCGGGTDRVGRSDPDLQHVVERRLRVEEVDALKADAQPALRVAHQRVAVAAAEV